MDKVTKKEQRRNWFYSFNMIFDEVDISEHAKIVYLYLCRCADSEGQSFPSHATIAKRCGIKSRQTVINAIKELEENGLVGKQQRTRKDKGKTSNLYIVYDSPKKKSEDDHVQDLDIPHVQDVDIPHSGDTHVQEMDISCLSGGQPPMQETDNPCPADGHKGLPKEGQPNIKSISHSINHSGVTLHSSTKDLTDRQMERAKQLFSTLIENTKIHELPALEDLWLPVFEYMVFSPAFLERINRPWEILYSRLQKVTRETLHKTFRRVSDSLRANATEVTNSIAYLAVALYNEIGREAADNHLAFVHLQDYLDESAATNYGDWTDYIKPSGE